MNYYRVLSPLFALRWDLDPTGKNTAETVHLPKNAIVKADGQSSLGDGLMDISYNGTSYTVFKRDWNNHTVREPVASSLAVGA